jgi:hypothetical protein
LIQLHDQNDSFQGGYRDNRRYRNREKDQNSEIDPFQLQICMIQGTRNGIDRCLEIIREKFPLQQHQVCFQKKCIYFEWNKKLANWI